MLSRTFLKTVRQGKACVRTISSATSSTCSRPRRVRYIHHDPHPGWYSDTSFAFGVVGVMGLCFMTPIYGLAYRIKHKAKKPNPADGY